MPDKNFYALFDKPTPQNLEANQRGRLTLEQQSALKQAAGRQRSMIMFWAAIVLMVAGYMVFFLWQVEGEDGSLSLISVGTIGLVMLGVVLLILFLMGWDAFMILSRDEIENGRIESVVGKVAWVGGRYRAISDARKLKVLRYQVALPPPGDYRFYCLPRSGLVIMAEELGLVSAWHTQGLLLDALARANHFSMEDLESNRAGSLTGRQEVRLFGYAMMLIVLVLLCVGITFFAIRSRLLGEGTVLFALLTVIGLFLFLRIGWSVINIFVDIWNGSAEQVDGLVTRHVHRSRNTRYYTYQINGFKFHVSKSAYNALIEGRNYRVYFAPRSKRLVAIEPA
jgi:hypothetical protein